MLLLRSALFNAFLYLFTALCSVFAMCLAVVRPRSLPGFARWWSFAWLGAYRRICGVNYRLVGAQYMPPGGCIVAMKHQSTWDTFALFAVLREPVFVFKSELARIPFFGWALLELGCIPVKRGAGKSAVESMITGAVAAFQRGKQVVVFPEGTRSMIGTASEYKTGVSHLYNAVQVPCVPVALNSGLVWPRRSFLRPPGVVTVQILPAIEPGMPRKQMHELLVERIETASQKLAASD